MTANPVAWVGKYLSDVEGLLDAAGVPRDEIGATDADDLRTAIPEIMDAVRRLLERVRAGELALPPATPSTAPASAGSDIATGDPDVHWPFNAPQGN